MTKESRATEGRAVRAWNYALLTLMSVLILFPIGLLVVIAFKTDAEYMNSSVLDMPESFANFENYKIMFEKANLALAFRNTLVLIVTSAAGSILMGSMIAFALARLDLPYKKLFLTLFVLPVFIPTVTTQVSIFSLIKNLSLYNTIYAGMLLYLAADVVQIYLFVQFMNKIPRALDESARIEGASYFRIYRSIIVPQMLPAVATVLILRTISVYNDVLMPYLYMPKSTLRTVSTALMNFATDRGAQWNVMAAGIVTIMIPTILLYVFLQRYIVAGMTDGSVK